MVGTRPWSSGKGEQRIDDGRIEVMGLTTYTLPRLQAGMTATCLTQCSRAKMTTTKTIPMQVDGEASRLNPGTIELTFLNQVNMMVKAKSKYYFHFVCVTCTLLVLLHSYVAFNFRPSEKPWGKSRS